MVSPSDYAECSVLARAVGKELLSRLDWMQLQPHYIADMRCRTGELTQELAVRYPKAQILGIDNDMTMLHYAQQHVSKCIKWLLADGESIPIAGETLDFICSHFLLPWHMRVIDVLQEWQRLLQPGGLLLFTSFGPDTLREWASLLSPSMHIVDMHELGDALVQAGFVDPVLEVDHYTLTYTDPAKFLYELQVNAFIPRDLLLSTIVMQQYSEQVQLTATFEVIYGHAWMPKTRGYRQDAEGVARIPLTHLRGYKGEK